MIPRANVLFGLCLLAGLLVLNTACATSHGRPPLSKMTNQWTKYYSEKGDQIDHQLKFVDEFEKKRAGDKEEGIEPYTSEQLRLERNEIIGRLITIAEEVHATIDENLRNSRAYGNVFMDAAQIVTTGLSVLANSAATADKFATAALASKGFQESVDKRLFYEHATSAVVNQMHLLRVEAKKPLIAGLSRTIDDYPLSIAISEWGTYFLSGNVTEALSRIGTDAKAKELKLLEIIADLLALGKDETGTGTAEIEAAHKKAEAGAATAESVRADDVVKAVAKESNYVKDKAGDAIRRFWKPDGTTIDPDNQQRIRTWMSLSNIDPDTTSMTDFMRSDGWAEFRLQAARKLGLLE